MPLYLFLSPYISFLITLKERQDWFKYLQMPRHKDAFLPPSPRRTFFLMLDFRRTNRSLYVKQSMNRERLEREKM